MRQHSHPSRLSHSKRREQPFRRTGPGRATVALAILLTAMALTGCSLGATPSPTVPLYTSIPIGPTPWPSGTTGQYGLRIDPSLLGKLPQMVDAYPLVEDAESESLVMDDRAVANTFDRYAAARIGELSGDNWLFVAMGHFKIDVQSSAYADTYQAWVSQYATGACSQANGVLSSSQQEINSFYVDTATCGGGPVVYTLPLGNGLVLSMFGLGPRDLGRALIKAIYFVN